MVRLTASSVVFGYSTRIPNTEILLSLQNSKSRLEAGIALKQQILTHTVCNQITTNP